MIARRNTLSTVLAVSLSLLAGWGCSKPAPKKSEEKTQPAKVEAPASVSLSGAGATFPFPLYSKWMSEYNKLRPEVKINYQSIGSGGGIRQVTQGTVDFGATDVPMSEADAQKASGKIAHIPTTIGAVVVAYDLPEAGAALKLDPETLSAIFLGKVKKWNDPKIVAQNPELKLPAKDIAVVTRSDGSGTTAVFTGYLSLVSEEWKTKVGEGKSVKWPAGLGAKGNEGVTGQLKSTPGSIGYIELAYAVQNKLPMAALKNKAGKYVAPSESAVTEAAAHVTPGEDLTATLANAEGEGSYPVASYTYILVYEDAKDQAKGEALANFLWWSLHDGQKFAGELQYAPLPATMVEKVSAKLKTLSFKAQPLLK